MLTVDEEQEENLISTPVGRFSGILCSLGVVASLQHGVVAPVAASLS